MEWWQILVLVVVVGVFFVAGFLLGEYLHGLGGTLSEALSAAWQRFLNLFRPHGAVPPGSVRAVDGTLVVADGNCHNGWSAFPGDTSATRCIDVPYA